ncbi:MAG: hypothetical protein ACO1O6_01055 [Bacteroidota bacterium]
MDTEFDKYNSITFQEYFSKRNGHKVYLSSNDQLIKIQNKTGMTTGVVHFSNSINHNINSEELLNSSEKSKKAYYVYENGAHGYDWLWCYKDLMPINELF